MAAACGPALCPDERFALKNRAGMINMRMSCCNGTDSVITAAEFYPPESECMTMEQMLLGYTINGAKQLRLDRTKGSIEAGKDADYIVLKENLLEISAEGICSIVPEEVYFRGRKMN